MEEVLQALRDLSKRMDNLELRRTKKRDRFTVGSHSLSRDSLVTARNININISASTFRQSPIIPNDSNCILVWSGNDDLVKFFHKEPVIDMTSCEHSASDVFDVLTSIEKGEMKNSSCLHDKDITVSTPQGRASNVFVAPSHSIESPSSDVVSMDEQSAVTALKVTNVVEQVQYEVNSFNTLAYTVPVAVFIASVKLSHLLLTEVTFMIWDPGGWY
jgi:hypothetical protein